MSNPFEMSDDTPVYVISVAAQLSGMHPQTLRAYDRMGLVSPGRTVGRGRRYSLRDILTLREVQRLSQEDGVNLSGIKRILELEAELDQFRRAVAELTERTARLRDELESTRAVAARLAGLLRSRTDAAEPAPASEHRDRARRSGKEPGPAVMVDRPALPAARTADSPRQATAGAPAPPGQPDSAVPPPPAAPPSPGGPSDRAPSFSQESM